MTSQKNMLGQKKKARAKLKTKREQQLSSLAHEGVCKLPEDILDFFRYQTFG